MSVDLYVCPACEQQATREVRVGRTGPTKGVRVVVLKRMPGPPDPSAATCEFCATPLVLPDFAAEIARDYLAASPDSRADTDERRPRRVAAVVTCERCRKHLATVHTKLVRDGQTVFQRSHCAECQAEWALAGSPGLPQDLLPERLRFPPKAAP